MPHASERDAAAYLLNLERRFPGWTTTAHGRRAVTRTRPKAFALVYLAHHLADPSTRGRITFGEQHEDWYRQMQGWINPPIKPREWRRAYVAPRHSAKSTTWFLIAPLWAAAHGHARFVAAFGDNAGIAERHLGTFKAELAENELLRRDYPELCRPKVRERGTVVSDSRSMIHQDNGFVFAARGVSGTSLGLKVGNLRPDVLIMDDVEPQAEEYSAYQAERRLDTLQNAILPMNANARVVLVGTVTMDGSLIHQLVKSVTTTEDPARWIADERFGCHYYPAIMTNEDGSERSLWPEKWPLADLQSMRHTRSFALQFQNQPMAADGAMWSPDDLVVSDPGPDVLAGCRHLLSVDPAVTSKKRSDATGVALLSHDRVGGKVYVRRVWQLRQDPKTLRTTVGRILAEHPEVRGILVEVNQGGEAWRQVFGEYPGVRYTEVVQSVKKEVRAGWLLDGYQRRVVVHAAPLPALDAELLAFPRGLHDDLVDAVGSGYTALTGAGQTRRPEFRARTV